MNLLKKIGTIMLKATEIWIGFWPLVSATIPGSSAVVQTVSKDLIQIADIIVQVESIGQALGTAGPQKAVAAAPLVAQVVMSSALMAHHQIADEAAFKAACVTIAGGFADLLNALKGDVVTISKT